MFTSYFKSKSTVLYVLVVLAIIIAGVLFFVSEISYNQVDRIKLVSPFVGIVGQQRDSMAKLYLNLIAETKNSSSLSQSIMKNIRMFEANKKGVIDSLIAKQFSNDYLNFYNEIWFNPCDVLQVAPQCAELFAGILSDNLDYNYVYILTEV